MTKKNLTPAEQARKDWAEAIAKKPVAFYARGNSRIRVELIVYAVDANGMLLGYYVDSLNVGVIFDKPRERDSIMFFRAKAETLKELYK